MKDLSKLSDEELELMSNPSTASISDMSDEELAKMAGGSGEVPSTPRKVGIVSPLDVGLGAGVGAYAAGRAWNAPKRQVNVVEQQLQKLGKNIPSQLPPELQQLPSRGVDVPGRIARQLQEQRIQIKDFDDFVLSTSAEDLASTVKEVFPKFRELNFKAYGDAIKAGEELIEKSGSQLDTFGFDSKVIQKTTEALKYSIPDEQLKKLTEMQGAEKTIANKKLSLGQAKKYLEKVSKDLPPEAQRTLRSNWGKYLEEVGGNDVKEVLSSANKKYAMFKEQDNALRKLIDPKTGEYDYDKIYRYTLQRAKTRINSDFKKLMSGLGEVSGDVKEKSKNLYYLRNKRVEMQRTLNTLRTWLNKAEELVSKKAAIIEKHPVRLGGLAKAARRGAEIGRAHV